MAGPLKIAIHCAHPDDGELGCGGRIVQHIKNGDDVYTVIFGTGQTSHRSVLGTQENPSPDQVREKKMEEGRKAAKLLGVKRVYLVSPPGSGRVRENKKHIKNRVEEITGRERPDIIYYHLPDAHGDHRATAEITEDILKEVSLEPDLYQFPIWTKETAKGRPEVKKSDAPEISSDLETIKIDISEELPIKRRAIYQHRSQVLNWPYKDWQVQEKPILDKRFLQHFLREEEIFYKRGGKNG